MVKMMTWGYGVDPLDLILPGKQNQTKHRGRIAFGNMHVLSFVTVIIVSTM